MKKCKFCLLIFSVNSVLLNPMDSFLGIVNCFEATTLQSCDFQTFCVKISGLWEFQECVTHLGLQVAEVMRVLQY